MAVNRRVEPTVKLAGEVGVTVMEDNVAATVVVGVVIEVDVAVVVGLAVVVTVEVVVAVVTIVNLEGELLTPPKVPVMLAFPTAIPVANPVESIVAFAAVSLDQVTLEEMSAVEPSE